MEALPQVRNQNLALVNLPQQRWGKVLLLSGIAIGGVALAIFATYGAGKIPSSHKILALGIASGLTIIGSAGIITGITLLRFKKRHVSSDCPIRSGGISNGGNTCYIATCIQCIRSLRYFPKYLQGDKGSIEKNDIRDKLIQILDKLRAGIGIDTSEINEFRSCLHKYDTIIHLQNGAEVFEAWLTIASALGLPQIEFSDKDKVRQSNWHVVTIDDTAIQASINNINFLSAPEILPIHINLNGNKQEVIFNEFLEINCNGETKKYRLKELLTGVSIATRTHTWAAVRNRECGNYDLCNDSRVSSLNSIDSLDKTKVRTLFYELENNL